MWAKKQEERFFITQMVCTTGFSWFNSWRLLIFGDASVCQLPQVVISKPNVAGFEESVWRGCADDRNDSNSRQPSSAPSTPAKVSPYVPKIDHIASHRLWMFFLPRMRIGLTKKISKMSTLSRKLWKNVLLLPGFFCLSDGQQAEVIMVEQGFCPTHQRSPLEI